MAEKVDVTAETWNELKASKALVLVEIYKEWTGPCVVLEPTIKTIENSLPNPEQQLVVARANVDTRADVSEFEERAKGNSVVPEFWLMVSTAGDAKNSVLQKPDNTHHIIITSSAGWKSSAHSSGCRSCGTRIPSLGECPRDQGRSTRRGPTLLSYNNHYRNSSAFFSQKGHKEGDGSV